MFYMKTIMIAKKVAANTKSALQMAKFPAHIIRITTLPKKTASGFLLQLRDTGLNWYLMIIKIHFYGKK
jgi:hypothetical protein